MQLVQRLPPCHGQLVAGSRPRLLPQRSLVRQSPFGRPVRQQAIQRALQPRHVATAAAGISQLQSSKFRRSIWTAVDVAALLGSVAGALAALLGVVSPTYALTLPLVLPVVSLIAALQREDLTAEDGRQYLEQLSSVSRDSTALLRDAAAAIDEVRREVRSQSAAAGRLAALEEKLAVLEGAALGAARSSREAAAGVNALGASLSASLQQASAMAQQQQLQQGPVVSQQSAQALAGLVAGEVMPLIKAELAASLGPWAAESAAALRRLDTRLAVVEGSLAGLEMSQNEGLMRLGSSFSGSMADATSGLQSCVRVELATAVEPLKQLPQLVAAAAAKAAAEAAAQQQATFPLAGAADGAAEGSAGSAAFGGAGASQVGQSLLLQQLQEVVTAEVAAATQQVLEQQASVLATLAQPPQPTPLAADQWEALGRRLARLERLLTSLPESSLSESALAGQLAPLVAAQQSSAAAVQDAVAARLDRLDAALQQLSAAGGAAGADAGASAAVQQQLDGLARAFDGMQPRLEQLQDSMLQMLAYSKQAGLVPPGGAGDAAAASPEALLAPLLQQLQQVGAMVQQLQQELPLQVCSALASASAAGAASDAFNGALYDDGSTADRQAGMAASVAAAAAAEGIGELRQLLRGVQSACEDLQVQVGALAAQVAAQQASILSTSSSASNGQAEAAAAAAAAAASSSAELLEVAQQQLVAASSQLSQELSEQLTSLCGGLQQQLQDLQQQLVDAATAAASQAAADVAAAAAAAAAVGQAPAGAVDYSSGGMWGAAAAPGGGNGNGASAAATAAPAAFGDEQQYFGPDAAAAVGLGPSSAFGAEAAPGGWGGFQPADAAAAAAAGGWPGATAAEQGPSPAAWQPAGSLEEQQQQWQPPAAALQQQQSAADVGTPTAPTQQQPQPLAVPDVSQLSEEALRTDGLRLLRLGREATRGSGIFAGNGPDFAAAESQLQAAVACFSAAVESEPQDTRALGNLGNALLAQGELKKALLEELLLSVAQGGMGLGSGAAQSLGAAEARLRTEAAGLWTRAGEIFRRVLEVDGWSSRALVNWGKALVSRAELAADRSAATKLYNAAIDKFEAVLEEDPGLVVAKYRCALAMQGLAALSPAEQQQGGGGGSRQRMVLLADAAAYLSDVVAGDAGGDAGLREAAAAALRQVQQSLEMAKLS